MSENSPSSLTAVSWAATRALLTASTLVTTAINGCRDRGQLGRDVTITGTDALVSRHTEPDDIYLAQRAANDVVEPFAQQGARTMQSRGVDDDELRVRAVDDSANRAPCRLRLVTRDRDFGADQRVRQGGLASVRPADEATESRAEDALRRRLDRHLESLPLFVQRFLDSFQNKIGCEGIGRQALYSGRPKLVRSLAIPSRHADDHDAARVHGRCRRPDCAARTERDLPAGERHR